MYVCILSTLERNIFKSPKFFFLASVRHHEAFEKTTDHEIESCVKKWLVHAKDRDGGRQERDKKNHERTQIEKCLHVLS